MENILVSTEVDLYIQNISSSDIEEIGSRKWLKQHGRLSKLAQQAILEATTMREENVKELLISSEKIPIIIYEAILISIWRQKLFEPVIQQKTDLSNTFSIYSVLYHENTCVTLLETVLFHENSCESLQDVSIDLVDYCYEAIIQIFSYKYKEPSDNENPCEELRRLKSDLEYDIGIRSITIIRYFAEYLHSLTLSVTTRMLCKLDVPLLLTQLITSAPWIRKNKHGDTLKYFGGKWKKIEGDDCMKIIGAEAQVWMALQQLLLNPEFFNHYELSDFRRNNLIKLQKYLHETVLDQMSPLISLKQWLSHLSISGAMNSFKRQFVLEIIPEIKQSILSKYEKKWNSLVKKQVDILLQQNHDKMVEMAKSIYEAYTSVEVMENISTINENSCVQCSNSSNNIKKCSRCKNEWYCSRNCQVKHWPLHKETCNINIGENDSI